MISSSMPKPAEPIGPVGVSKPIGPTGSIGATGPNETAGANGVTLDGLARLKAGAKVGAPPPRAKRPWDGLDPAAPAVRSRALRLNPYDRALLAYLAGLQGGSIQQTIIKLVRKAALEEIAKREG